MNVLNNLAEVEMQLLIAKKTFFTNSKLANVRGFSRMFIHNDLGFYKKLNHCNSRRPTANTDVKANY